MGQSSSNLNQNISSNARKMLNAQAGGNYSEHQTINFSRNDLVDTVSALDLNSVFELHGGSKNINLNNIPNRNRYSEFIVNNKPKNNSMRGGSRGGVIGGYSSTSEGDLSIIKSMIIGQNGGTCGTPNTPQPPQPSSEQNEGCGCDNSSVLNGGAFNLGKILAKQMTSTVTESSSYNPLNSMSSEKMYGGNVTSSVSTFSATSDMEGGFNNSILSATSPMQMSQQGGNMSATSPMLMSYKDNLSATSPMQMSQQGGAASSSSPLFSATSPLNLQNGGVELSSATSSLPINYDSLVGGKKKNKIEKKTKKSDESESSESSESSGRLLMMEDMDASSSSTTSESMDESDAIIARALRSDVPSEKTRELQRFSSEKQEKTTKHKKSKDDTPSTNSSTSSSSTSTNTSSTKSTSGTSVSSSSTDGEAIAKVNSYKYANLIITSPNSASVSDSLINAKQFYSSENGELFSSDSNFLRHNINKNRLR